jgi:hypothetical protein
MEDDIARVEDVALALGKGCGLTNPMRRQRFVRQQGVARQALSILSDCKIANAKEGPGVRDACLEWVQPANCSGKIVADAPARFPSICTHCAIQANCLPPVGQQRQLQ